MTPSLAELEAAVRGTLERAGISHNAISWASPGGYCPSCEMADGFHDDGDCEIVASLAALSLLVARAREMEEALRLVEWQWNDRVGQPVCYVCDAKEPEGHHGDCPVGDALFGADRKECNVCGGTGKIPPPATHVMPLHPEDGRGRCAVCEGTGKRIA